MRRRIRRHHNRQAEQTARHVGRRAERGRDDRQILQRRQPREASTARADRRDQGSQIVGQIRRGGDPVLPSLAVIDAGRPSRR